MYYLYAIFLLLASNYVIGYVSLLIDIESID